MSGVLNSVGTPAVTVVAPLVVRIPHHLGSDLVAVTHPPVSDLELHHIQILEGPLPVLDDDRRLDDVPVGEDVQLIAPSDGDPAPLVVLGLDEDGDFEDVPDRRASVRWLHLKRRREEEQDSQNHITQNHQMSLRGGS